MAHDGSAPEGDTIFHLTAAGLQAAAGLGPADERAIFRVVSAGNVFLSLRAAGNGGAAILAALEQGDRVEIRILPPVDAVHVEVGKPGAVRDAGSLAGWGPR
jgi:hypothetical protein